MTYNELFEQVKKKKSFLCVGLDSDIKKLPQHLMGAEDPVYEFNKAIVDATADVAIAYTSESSATLKLPFAASINLTVVTIE